MEKFVYVEHRTVKCEYIYNFFFAEFSIVSSIHLLYVSVCVFKSSCEGFAVAATASMKVELKALKYENLMLSTS